MGNYTCQIYWHVHFDGRATAMKVPSKKEVPQIRPMVANERGRTYPYYRLTRPVDGRRIRQRFKSLDEAVGEKSRLSIQLANAEGEIRAI